MLLRFRTGRIASTLPWTVSTPSCGRLRHVCPRNESDSLLSDLEIYQARRKKFGGYGRKDGNEVGRVGRLDSSGEDLAHCVERGLHGELEGHASVSCPSTWPMAAGMAHLSHDWISSLRRTATPVFCLNTTTGSMRRSYCGDFKVKPENIQHRESRRGQPERRAPQLARRSQRHFTVPAHASTSLHLHRCTPDGTG